jgi:Fe2+ or Zn2+ uptake regulation protein
MTRMNEHDHALLKKLLKENGYSVTTARLAVCEALWDKEPQSMHDLAATLADTIDRASLYRVISLFERLGIVQRIYIGWKYKVELSDIFAHHHHHISCLNCGMVIPIQEEAQIETMLAAIARRYNFLPKSHMLEIQGYCQSCAATLE